MKTIEPDEMQDRTGFKHWHILWEIVSVDDRNGTFHVFSFDLSVVPNSKESILQRTLLNAVRVQLTNAAVSEFYGILQFHFDLTLMLN